MKAASKITNTFTAVFQKTRGGYTTWLEEMPNVISEGKTRAEAARNLKDALALMLETNRIMSFKDVAGEVERASFSFPVRQVA
jgi:predicted RNase H-like HicB family nuclease